MTLPGGNPSSRWPRDASPGGGASADEDGGGCAAGGEAGGGEEEVEVAAAGGVASYAAAAAAAPSGALPAAASPSPRCSHPRRRGRPEISQKKINNSTSFFKKNLLLAGFASRVRG